MTAAGILAVAVAFVLAYRLHGEWSALALIADGVVLGYALITGLLGWGLRQALKSGARPHLAWIAVWALLGPVPLSLYWVFHWLKLVREGIGAAW